MTSLSVIVPTHDGEGLDRCLASVMPQLAPDDEIIVAWDSHDDLPGNGWDQFDDPNVRALVHDAGYHAWGHPQRRVAQEWARGDYLVHIDDDDELAPDALAAIRAAIERNPGRPLMFRFLAPFGLVMPQYPLVAEGNVGGTGFVTPNDPRRLGRWSDRYQGDYDYITSTLDHYPPNALVWEDAIIARCAVGEPRVWFNLVTTPGEVEEMRIIRNAGREWMTHDTSEISPQQQARWWAERDPERVQAWLALHGHEVLGYGLLTVRQGACWASLAVALDERGKGIGTAIYRHLIEQCPADRLYIETRYDNEPSIRAAQRAGFEWTVGFDSPGTSSGVPGIVIMTAKKRVAALV